MVYLNNVGNDISENECHGEWTGLVKFSEKGANLARAEIEEIQKDGTLKDAGLPTLLTRLADKGEKIAVVYVSGQWLDVDDYVDLMKAGKFL